MRSTSGAAYAARKYHQFTVKENCTLFQFLERQFSGMSRNKIKDILSGHAVTVDGKAASRHDMELHPRQSVRITKHKRSTELTSKFVKLIYEDKDIIVIEKAPGILSMAGNPQQFSVKTVLDEYFAKRHFKCRAHVVHRLDRETSGLMVYAKDIEAEQILERNWHDIVTDRRYVAIVCGRMERQSGTVQSWLKDNKQFVTYSSPTDNGGKLAVTHYRVLQANDDFSLVELKLETGRKNQIRVHMQLLGHPVAGDAKYGALRNPVGRLALHAFRLNFYHPMTSLPLSFETPFPTLFTRLFEKKTDKNEEN